MKKIGCIGLVVLFLLFAAIGNTNTARDKKLATPTATVQPSSNPTSTQSTTPTPPALRGTRVKVVNVVDGDTIKIETGETVRYIGIDTPETVDPRRPVMCMGKEASNKNNELVLGKTVEMEKDISDKDKYGRLLRYIWLDGVLINELLVREGFAQSSSYPPDIKYQERFNAAQKQAQMEKKGLWSATCSMTPTPTTRQPNVPPPIYAPTSNNSNSGNTSGGYACDCNKACAKMSSCTEAQYQLNSCGCSARDGDGDGIACDSDCQ